MKEITVNIVPSIKNIVINIVEDPNAELTHDDMYKALESMIRWTRQLNNKKEIRMSSKHMSELMWSKEMCTVKFCLPRQSGHTTFIKKLIGPNAGPLGACPGAIFQRPIVIFPHNSVAADMVSPGWVWRGTPDKLEKFRGMTPDGIIIDCASVYSKNEIEKIYKAFGHFAVSNTNFLFVFIE